MEKKKTIVIVDCLDNKKIKFLNKKYTNDDIVIYSLIKDHYDHKKFNVLELDELISKDNAIYIEEKANSWSADILNQWQKVIETSDYPLTNYIHVDFYRSLVFSLKRVFRLSKIRQSYDIKEIIAINIEEHFFNVIYTVFNNVTIIRSNLPSNGFNSSKFILIKIFFRQILNKIIDLLFSSKYIASDNNILWAGIRTNKSNAISRLIKLNYHFILLAETNLSARLEIIKNKGKYSIIKYDTGNILNYNDSLKLFKIIKNKYIFFNTDCGFFLQKLISQNLSRIIKYRYISESLKNNNYIPKLIFLPQDYSSEFQLLSDYGNKNDIPIIVMSHGVYESNYFNNKTKSFPFYGTLLLTFGLRDKNWLINRGIRKEKIIVTGASEYKTHVENKNKRRYLLLISQWFDYYTAFHGEFIHNKMIELIFELSEKFPFEEIILKLHPNQSVEERINIKKIILEKKLKNVKVLTNVNLNKILLETKICFLRNSTVGVEAMLADCHMILLDYFKELPVTEYDIYSKFISTHSIEETIALAKIFLDNKSDEYSVYKNNKIKSLDYFLSCSGDKATQNLVNVIKTVTNT